MAQEIHQALKLSNSISNALNKFANSPLQVAVFHFRNFINLPEVSGPSKRVDLIDFRLKKLQDSIRLETARFKLAKGDRRPKSLRRSENFPLKEYLEELKNSKFKDNFYSDRVHKLQIPNFRF